MLTPHASTAAHWLAASACRRRALASVPGSRTTSTVAPESSLCHSAEVHTRGTVAPTHLELPITAA